MNQQEKKGLMVNLIIDHHDYHPLHVRQNLFMDVDIDKKQEVLTFFDVFISLYLSKYFREYSDGLFKDEPDCISLMFRDKVDLDIKQRGRVFNRLHGMVKQAEAYFKYLDHYKLKFNQKGLEYYLKLRSLGKYINKDTLLKRSVITLDVNYLKIYNNFFNRNKTREDVNNQNKKLNKFQETMSEIYLDAVAYLKFIEEQTMNNEITLKDNDTEVKETSTESELGSMNIKLKFNVKFTVVNKNRHIAIGQCFNGCSDTKFTVYREMSKDICIKDISNIGDIMSIYIKEWYFNKSLEDHVISKVEQISDNVYDTYFVVLTNGKYDKYTLNEGKFRHIFQTAENIHTRVKALNIPKKNYKELITEVIKLNRTGVRLNKALKEVFSYDRKINEFKEIHFKLIVNHDLLTSKINNEYKRITQHIGKFSINIPLSEEDEKVLEKDIIREWCKGIYTDIATAELYKLPFPDKIILFKEDDSNYRIRVDFELGNGDYTPYVLSRLENTMNLVIDEYTKNIK